MPGEIKSLINRIINNRSKGDPILIKTTTTKLILKGFDPDNFTETSMDNPKDISKVKEIAKEMGVTI